VMARVPLMVGKAATAPPATGPPTRLASGQWLASRIPGVEAWFFDDEGHALRKNHIEDIHAWLVARSS
jgi:hypothetical protein